MYRTLTALTTALVLIAGCSDKMSNDSVMPTSFSVTVENVSTVYPFSSSGVFNTPAGAADAAPIFPGEVYEVSFSAAPGQKLSFITMFVQSNDLFYAPDVDGIDLYDANNDPVTGDVTDQLILWDAGTEVNQEPGAGADQAPRQSGANTGAAENGLVQSVSMTNDGFTYPAASEVIQATLMNSGGTTFTLTIENVSTSSTITTSDNQMAAVPLSPGVWVVHSDSDPLFMDGVMDDGSGLEHLAEDGDPTDLYATISAETGYTSPIAPLFWAVHTLDMPIFTEGQMDNSLGLEHLAEDGDPGSLASSLNGADGIASSGTVAIPDGMSSAGPAAPDASYSFDIEAEPGDKLSIATMLVQSNDLFFAPGENGILLFDSNDNAMSGNVTMYFYLWDAGTEVNEEPGIGLNQAPRQSAPNTGMDENGVVEQIGMVSDGFSYPDVSNVIKVTITPMN